MADRRGQSEASVVFKSMFKPRPALIAGQALYAAAVAQARTPAFYAEFGAPDTGEGRFELYSLHVMLLLRRLKAGGEQAAETAQGLFDAYIDALDIALREMGTGDLSMGKKMKKLGQAFYGRVRAYEEALSRLPDRAALTAIVERTIQADDQAERFVAYAAAVDAHLAALPLQQLLSGECDWPKVTA
jgi:cytochrome b pre-mRNA-processing protein 3